MVIELPLFDHVHGFYSGDEFGGGVEFLESSAALLPDRVWP